MTMFWKGGAALGKACVMKKHGENDSTLKMGDIARIVPVSLVTIERL